MNLYICICAKCILQLQQLTNCARHRGREAKEYYYYCGSLCVCAVVVCIYMDFMTWQRRDDRIYVCGHKELNEAMRRGVCVE